LNSVLYRNLERKFGVGSVQIVNENAEIIWDLRYDPARREQRRYISSSGEEYRVNCPFCRESRKRLYINHLFGVIDPLTSSPNLWLARCFNEDCLARDNSLGELLHFELLAGRPLTSASLRRGVVFGRVNAEWPGVISFVDQLEENHPAVVYLRGRNFDPYVLGRQWSVAFCYDSVLTYVRNRIIIPFFSGGELVGWVARYIGNDVLYDPITNRKIPKYYNMPGFQRKTFAFNFDIASKYKTMVIVEGVFDALRTGVYAVAALGKSVSYEMRQRIISAARQNGEDTTIVVMLDPDQDRREAVLREKHHIARLADQFREGWSRVVEVYIPSGTDPGDTPSSLLHQYIEEAAKCNGISLNWRQACPVARTDQKILWL
jgi:hypothetical protein